jgi:hypothetical protein
VAGINAKINSLFLHTGAVEAVVAANKIQLSDDTSVGANATDDYYNGCVVAIMSGAGAGQSRVITDYEGGTRIATVDSNWATLPNTSPQSYYAIIPGARPWELQPNAELSSVPVIGGSGESAPSYGHFLQLLFQRFAYKITQDFERQAWYNAAADDVSFQRGVSDDGATQTLNLLENS